MSVEVDEQIATLKSLSDSLNRTNSLRKKSRKQGEEDPSSISPSTLIDLISAVKLANNLLTVLSNCESLQTKVTSSSSRLDALESKIGSLQTIRNEERNNFDADQPSTKVDYLENEIRKLQIKCNRDEIKSRELNLIIFGLEPTEDLHQEDPVNTVTHLFRSKLGINIPIEAAWRIGKGRDGKPPLMKIKLKQVSDRKKIFSNVKSLAGSNISIGDDLSYEERVERRKQLPKFKELRAEGKKVVMRGCRIFLDGKPLGPLP